MAQTKQISRLEVNKKVRGVLCKHRVSITNISYSCSGYMVRIYGLLLKENNQEFELQAVDALLRELVCLSCVKNLLVEFSNWNISREGTNFTVSKKQEEINRIRESKNKNKDKDKDKDKDKEIKNKTDINDKTSTKLDRDVLT
ncbi:MAG: hypothetical protein HQK49_15635 [Oligoflexia bacterium]|nr:hypothetical protein [Oligoflexia bacterium]